jgi:hypothetical protein
MRILRIGLMVLLAVFWFGAVWAGQSDRDDRSGRPGWEDNRETDDRDHRNDKRGKDDFAPVPQTGQVISYDANTPKRDDGALQKGVEWPTPRFTDRGDGTIKDNLTGLIWLKNANCLGRTTTWQAALDFVAELNTSGRMNNIDCDDTSGKRKRHRTNWRLPNIRELFSLVDFGVNVFQSPVISNVKGDAACTPDDCAFSNFQYANYWSSTSDVTSSNNSNFAWKIFFNSGVVERDVKAGNSFVTAVRGDSEDK